MEEKELSQNREVQKGNSGPEEHRERTAETAEKAEEKKKASEQAVT